MDRAPSPPTLEALLANLAALLAPHLARELAACSVPPHPEHASAKHNPLGSARAFLDAGRRGDFETFKRGKEVVARWVDVVTSIERKRHTPQLPARPVRLAATHPANVQPPAAPEDDKAKALRQLAAVGLLPGSPPRRPARKARAA